MKCIQCGSELTTGDGYNHVCRACQNKNNNFPIGWICPRCGKVHSPFSIQCDCPAHTYTSANTNTVREPVGRDCHEAHQLLTVRSADKQKYVVGFMFDSERNNVVLIRKQKPAWQKNKLNGIGGKIEPDETPLQAMYREYKEEAGVAFAEWDNFLTVEYNSCIVYFFKGFSTACYNHSETRETERIEKYCLDGLPFSQMIYNLNWIIFLALDPDVRLSEAFEYAQLKVTEALQSK